MEYCPHCMAPNVSGHFCTHCGYDLTWTGQKGLELPIGTTLIGSSGLRTYWIGAALGQGGFGITYAAIETISHERVAIKEFFPSQLAFRTDNQVTVQPATEHRQPFHAGLESFLREGRMLLAQKDLPSVVKVVDFIQANGTAYLVMEYLDGLPLHAYMKKRGGTIPAAELLQKLEPVFRDLSVLHQRGILHRDISPDNLMWMPDGTVKLMDFGSARSMEGSKSLTTLMKEGFSPLEQYRSKGQGPYSDIYALSATIYYCLTGVIPPGAVDRVVEDELRPPRDLGVNITVAQENAILWGLSVQANARPQSMKQFHDALYGTASQIQAPIPVQIPQTSPAPQSFSPTQPAETPQRPSVQGRPVQAPPASGGYPPQQTPPQVAPQWPSSQGWSAQVPPASNGYVQTPPVQQQPPHETKMLRQPSPPSPPPAPPPVQSKKLPIIPIAAGAVILILVIAVIAVLTSGILRGGKSLSTLESNAPATAAPGTKTPATKAPATKAPTTEAPTTKAPASQTPASQTPASQPPATQTPEGSDETPSTPGPYQPVIDDSPLMADLNMQYAIDVEAEAARSDVLYDEIFGEYVAYYERALAASDQDERLGLMAIAEAKLLETGVVLPYENNAGTYSISRIIPHFGPTVSWGYDGDNRAYKSALIADRILTPAERAAFTAKWGECETAQEYLDYVHQWCRENGVTLQNTYTTTYTSDYEPDMWDALSSNKNAIGSALNYTWEGLLAYDCKNIQQPAMAERYEVSEDGLTYTFHIRPGMQWVTYQGNPIASVKADDWVAAVQHAADCGGGLSSVVACIVNLPEYVSGEVTDFSRVGIKAVDDTTLVVTLSEPTPWFVTVLGYSAMAPMCREYYISQGGKFGAAFNSSAADYTYGIDPQHIAYCGPYFISNWTYLNTIVYTKNPYYWNADAVTLDTITWLFNDGTDPLFAWNGFLDGTLNGDIDLSTAALEQAKATKVPNDPYGDTYFYKYAYVVLEDDTSFLNWVNINRYAYANYNDETVMRSPQTQYQAERTAAAKLNQNFRMALALSRDRATVNAAMVGEELKYAPLTNSYTPGSFIVAAHAFTVAINGTPTTFPMGTFYGEVLQAQLTADGYPMRVWDPNGNDGAGASYGFDGWYLPEEAAKYMDAAVKELAAQGIEISAENPIYLDYCYRDYSTIGAAVDRAMKQSIESALGGRVIINLISSEGSSNNVSYAAYMGDNGYQFNYDFGGSSGWSPDYGDAQTYLDTMLPTGGMMQNVGLW